MKILITGAAGFIGFHLTKRFLERGDEVLGVDNLNDYYDVSLKKARLANLEPFKNFQFKKIDIADRDAMEELFATPVSLRASPSGERGNLDGQFDLVVHLAAQAGVRYSIENPHAYIQSNVVGFLNVLEGCRKQISGHGTRDMGHGRKISNHGSPIPNSLSPVPCSLIYASSSSVYGGNTKLPFSVEDRVDQPISLYAATKRADELMAYTYSHLYGIPTTGLRFFTVYGPWGRPDMALFKFTKAILNGEPIDVYNEGRMQRDFTYVDDIVEGIVRLAETRGQKQEAGGKKNPTSCAVPLSPVPCPLSRLYNIGNHSPVELRDFIKTIEDAVGKKAIMNFLPMQPGDVPATYADVDDLMRDVGFAPKTPIEEGIKKFVEWYLDYYKKPEARSQRQEK